MKMYRRLLLGVLAVAAVVVAGRLWWCFSPREFQGTLHYHPNMVGIPEDPPALAHLVTTTETYELDLPIRTRGGLNRKLHRKLMDMNGKEVIVCGTLRIRRRPAYRPRGLYRKRRTIRVQELRLSTPGTTTSPSSATELRNRTCPASPARSPSKV